MNGVSKKMCKAATAFIAMAALVPSAYGQNNAAASEIRFQEMENEIRRLTGQVEEQAYEIRRLKEEMDAKVGDLEVRINDLNSGHKLGGLPTNTIEIYDDIGEPEGSAVASQGNIQSDDTETTEEQEFQYNSGANRAESQTLGTLNQPQDGGAPTASDPATLAYEAAYEYIKQRDFGAAEAAFASFLKSYPDHPLMGNAQYWYGETFYVRGNYDRSARIFAEGYQKYPQGQKAASNLLKLGMSLKGMGKQDDACIAFKQLQKDYDNAPVPVLKRAETEMQRINCT
ncbi:MAG: tol-pal system protein YbgF [Alphaproteobacteria bacterium]|nr:tol-pal system protein YbgF [Alphaproteobacteria bacterium]